MKKKRQKERIIKLENYWKEVKEKWCPIFGEDWMKEYPKTKR